MKNTITTFALVVAAFVAVNLLMSFAKPVAAPDEPKQYIIVYGSFLKDESKKFEESVNQKLAEGWHLQGSVSINDYGALSQAMTK